MLRIYWNASHRTQLLTLRLVEMTHALSAFVGINLVDQFAHRDGIVWASRLADIAVDAIVGDHQCHGVLRRWCRSAWRGDFLLQPALNRRKYKLRDITAQQGDLTHDGARDELILIRWRKE